MLVILQGVIRDEVVRVACTENLVTPHTAAVGVLLRSNPADASKAAQVEIPLEVSGSILLTVSPSHIFLRKRVWRV